MSVVSTAPEAERAGRGESVLRLEDVSVSYGRIQAVRGVSLAAAEGEVTVLLGANGAGKTTVLRAISGMVRPRGTITYRGTTISGERVDRTARRGIAHVAQGRGTLTELSVADNLVAGAYRIKDRAAIARRTEMVYELFPRLRERTHQHGGSLSGGEQQMLAIGRALMMDPDLLLLDEPSLGLAPTLIATVFDALRTINEELRTTMFIVEQNANLALRIADRGYVLETGEIVSQGSASELLSDDRIRKAYLGQ